LFEPLRVIGKGSFGLVVLARERATAQLRAVKVLSRAFVAVRNQEKHTVSERAALSAIRSPFVVRIHEAFRSRRSLYIVTDYASGGDLYTHLTRQRLSEPQVRFFLAQIAVGLHHCHDKGVVYRDLKPENVLVDSEGYVKLADFGLCRLGVHRCTSGATSFCGTPEYLAPEVLDRTGHGFAADWWTLGMLAYEMFTGLPPWFTEDRRELYRRRREDPLTFPQGCRAGAAARSLIRALLQRDAASRLGTRGGGRAGGAVDVLGHPFFGTMLGVPALVESLVNRTVASPLRSFIHGEDDVSNADPALAGMPPSFSAASFHLQAQQYAEAKLAKGQTPRQPRASFSDFDWLPQDSDDAGGGHSADG